MSRRPSCRPSVAARIASMDRTSPEIVKEVATVMEASSTTVIHRSTRPPAASSSLADDPELRRPRPPSATCSTPREEDAELAEEVRALMFVFEDILKLDDRAIQLVLKDVDTKDLALALRGATEDVKERILANMSSRGAEMLREEMEFMPPQRRRVIEEAQTKIVAVVRRLEDAGEIVIARGGGEDETMS